MTLVVAFLSFHCLEAEMFKKAANKTTSKITNNQRGLILDRQQPYANLDQITNIPVIPTQTSQTVPSISKEGVV